jgi:GNAT superfamily N-acetyltransferase
MYPEPGANHFTLTADQVADGAGGFVVAHLDDTPVGCGAYRMIEPGTAEIKRMFVAPDGRGIKLGAAILDTLESKAVADGATRLVLETGSRQAAALGLYERFGFTPTPAWGEYRDSPTSVCLGKSCA